MHAVLVVSEDNDARRCTLRISILVRFYNKNAHGQNRLGYDVLTPKGQVLLLTGESVDIMIIESPFSSLYESSHTLQSGFDRLSARRSKLGHYDRRFLSDT